LSANRGWGTYWDGVWVRGAISVGDGGQGARASKIREKYLSGNYYVKFWHFSE